MKTSIAEKDPAREYEQARRAEIERWLAAPPDWGTRLMAQPGKMAANAARQFVPVPVLRASLRTLERAAGRLSDARSVLRWAGVTQLDEIAVWPLRECDQLALKVQRRAMLLGGGSGAVFGIGGAVGMVADVPTLLTVALRTIHRTAYCYGEDWQREADRSMVIGVFALASANSLDEKRNAWAALRDGQGLLDAAWRDGVERVAERQIAKDAAQFSLQTLASRIGLRLGARKSAGVVPVLGAVIGSAINADYLRDLSRVSQRVLQDRWLRRTGRG